MKRMLSLLMALAMMLSLAACGGGDAPAENTGDGAGLSGQRKNRAVGRGVGVRAQKTHARRGAQQVFQRAQYGGVFPFGYIGHGFQKRHTYIIAQKNIRRKILRKIF